MSVLTAEQIARSREYAECHSNPLSQQDALDLFDTIDALRKQIAALEREQEIWCDASEDVMKLKAQLEQEEGENVSLSRVVGERGKEIAALKEERESIATIRASERLWKAKCENAKAQIASARLEEHENYCPQCRLIKYWGNVPVHQRGVRPDPCKRIAELEKAEKA